MAKAIRFGTQEAESDSACVCCVQQGNRKGEIWDESIRCLAESAGSGIIFLALYRVFWQEGALVQE